MNYFLRKFCIFRSKKTCDVMQNSTVSDGKNKEEKEV